MITIPSELIHDSTKLKCLMSCPRMYFFEHILGWKVDSTNVHLVFGEAYHKAMEVLLQNDYSEQSLEMAFFLFNEIYREHFDQLSDPERSPKNPMKALEALVSYVENYKEDNEKVLYTEISGSVPISPSRVIHFKLDSVLEGANGMIYSREHKTASQDSRQYHDQWDLSVQVGTYLHFLFCLYEAKKIRGVQINTTFLYKAQKAKFHRRFVTRTPEMMNAWLINVNSWITFLEFELERLSMELLCESDVMVSFPMNTENCTKYVGCVYHDFCVTWPNPIIKAESVPFGFHIEHWDPREIRTTTNIVIPKEEYKEIK